jgi:HD-GYP domain-containing protein (c-di-GMP phosphodiesterase class II)
LAGENIPVEARIIACCDSWHAMRSDRAYRKALTHEAALTELLENSGSQFDPAVVDALLQVIEGNTTQETVDSRVAVGATPQAGMTVSPQPL